MNGPRVVVVGGGLSGLISFSEAILNGAHGDILEKSALLGGNDRKFTLDLSEENKGFLQKVGVDCTSLSEETAGKIIKDHLVSFIKSHSVKAARIILGTEVVSILTDQDKSSALGVHFKRHFQSSGKIYSPEGNAFGDALVFAVVPSVLSQLCSDSGKIEENLLIKAQGAMNALFISKEEVSGQISLDSFISNARRAGKLASEAKPRKMTEKGIRQPLPFVDKSGVYHGVALKPSEWTPFVLENRMQLNRFNHLFRFSLPEPTDQCGLFCGQYISIRAVIDGKDVIRYYSPVSRNSDYGHIDLMIKIEEDTTNKPMEKFLSELKPGQTMDFKGPMGGFEYHRNMYREVGMIAGGTGITPMVQIIRSVANHPEDDTEVKLLYGNYNEDDILCRDELSYYTLTRTNINVYISLVNCPGKWSMGNGFVNKEMIAKALPAPADDIIILLCGPPPMIKANIVMLKEMGYTDQMIFSFI